MVVPSIIIPLIACSGFFETNFKIFQRNLIELIVSTDCLFSVSVITMFLMRIPDSIDGDSDLYVTVSPVFSSRSIIHESYFSCNMLCAEFKMGYVSAEMDVTKIKRIITLKL